MDIKKELSRRIKAAGSQAALAAELGVSVQYLCDVMKGRRQPGRRITAPLGVERVTTYRKRSPDNAAA